MLTASTLVCAGELRPIAPSHLTTILELLLTNLVSLSLSHTAAPISPLISALEDDHDIRREVTRQVMSWFGRLDDDNGTWEMDADAVVREVGLGILRAYRVLSSRPSRPRRTCANFEEILILGRADPREGVPRPMAQSRGRHL